MPLPPGVAKKEIYLLFRFRDLLENARREKEKRDLLGPPRATEGFGRPRPLGEGPAGRALEPRASASPVVAISSALGSRAFSSFVRRVRERGARKARDEHEFFISRSR